MITLLTIESELESAQSLGFHTCLSPEEIPDQTILVRWGNSSTVRRKCHTSSKAIRLNCAKNLALKKMASVVRTPHLFNKVVPDGKKAVHRSTAHSGGEGFKVQNGFFEIAYGHYATEFIRTDMEIRSWFSPRDVLSAIRIPFSVDQWDVEHPCRSLWGYKFINTPSSLKTQVLKASKSIGLSFGAADILVENGSAVFEREKPIIPSNPNSFIFVELNSAPTVDLPKIRSFFKKEILALS